jgi:hypothetical protein
MIPPVSAYTSAYTRTLIVKNCTKDFNFIDFNVMDFNVTNSNFMIQPPLEKSSPLFFPLESKRGLVSKKGYSLTFGPYP